MHLISPPINLEEGGERRHLARRSVVVYLKGKKEEEEEEGFSMLPEWKEKEVEVSERNGRKEGGEGERIRFSHCSPWAKSGSL